MVCPQYEEVCSMSMHPTVTFGMDQNGVIFDKVKRKLQNNNNKDANKILL
jgi:hypothetical protein